MIRIIPLLSSGLGCHQGVCRKSGSIAQLDGIFPARPIFCGRPVKVDLLVAITGSRERQQIRRKDFIVAIVKSHSNVFCRREIGKSVQCDRLRTKLAAGEIAKMKETASDKIGQGSTGRGQRIIDERYRGGLAERNPFSVSDPKRSADNDKGIIGDRIRNRGKGMGTGEGSCIPGDVMFYRSLWGTDRAAGN